MKKRSKLYDILFTLAFPVAAWLLMELLCFVLKDKHVISSMLDIKTVIRNAGISALIAFALSFNLSEGRLDLSLGAQRLAGTILGGTLAIHFGLSGFWLLIFSVIFGVIFGFVTGMLFVTLRVPPIVLGVGIALVWEVIPYVISNGRGLNLFGVTGMEILGDTAFQIIVVVVLAVIVYILMNFTKLGYEAKAVQGNQLVARNSGINIFRHAVLCYTLAGGVVCVAGVLEVAFTTQMASDLGNTSNTTVVANIFAMVLGLYIGERTNSSVGIISAALAIQIFKYGLSQMELSEANNNVVNMTVFIAFLVFQANKHKLALRNAQRERTALAAKERVNLQAKT